MELLSWSLVSPVEYAAGQELSFNVHFEAPADMEAKKFYILGGLYTDTTYTSGSLFGILKAADVDYGVNDPVYLSVWELEPGVAVDLPCRFILNQTNCLLALFLMRIVGDAPNLDSDEQMAQIQAQLAVPRTAWEQIQDIISRDIVPLTAAALMLGMIGLIGREMVRR
jgi:hypothetical protein